MCVNYHAFPLSILCVCMSLCVPAGPRKDQHCCWYFKLLIKNSLSPSPPLSLSLSLSLPLSLSLYLSLSPSLSLSLPLPLSLSLSLPLSLLPPSAHHSDVRVVSQARLTENRELLWGGGVWGDASSTRENGGAYTKEERTTYRLLPVLSVVRVGCLWHSHGGSSSVEEALSLLPNFLVPLPRTVHGVRSKVKRLKVINNAYSI